MTAATRRTTGLARANALLMVRNRLTLLYAVALPLVPMALLLTADRGDVDAGMSFASLCLTMTMLFPVYYNLLSIVVSRRDELVLKRLRTGETRDVEQLLAMALPGVAVTLVVSVLMVGAGVALGLPFPVNPVLFAVTVLVASAAFASLAVWTAAWTRNAEAAQLTSFPVILFTMVGQLKPVFPDRWRAYVELTPGAALDELVRTTWFGRGPDGAVDFASSWTATSTPLIALLVLTVLAGWQARSSMRWEPRV
jgi:ABC-2 type transport system permease protein